MEFCPKCGCILVEKDNKKSCPRCGYKSKGKVKIESSEKFKKNSGVGVVNEKDANVLPVTNAKCPKCGHTEAQFWTSQTRASDEAETKFYRCTKCKHTWREYH